VDKNDLDKTVGWFGYTKVKCFNGRQRDTA
jgi:hypothetical protein